MEHARSFIAGQYYTAAGMPLSPVFNPATGAQIGQVDIIHAAGLDAALLAASSGFESWRRTSAYERGRILQAAASLIRERKEAIGRLMTLEQGKPLAEAIGEVATSADNIEWMAQEATRAYGRLLVPRTAGITQAVQREPIGPVASFCPWNFPALTPARKIAGALAAGCSLILKPSEETPFTAAHIVRAFIDAGVPAGVLNLVYGKSRQVSAHLIASPVIRKISFTGSTAVGKELLALAAQGVKRATMELGGHAPVVVFDDVDPVAAARQAVIAKFRNAGQVCTSPTRFYVQAGIYPQFLEAFVAAARAIQVGDGMDPASQMGPLANGRRVDAMELLVADAVKHGARLECGGSRHEGAGHFFAPTVLSGVPESARIMYEEPFGPVVPLAPFDTFEEVLGRVNALPFGLAAYVMTRSLARASAMSDALEAGMVAVNHYTVSTPASPFGGVKESGYGSEGGIEGLDAYLTSKTVTQRVAGADLQPA
ncbi:NAD-dependent succinate-semialdehyde dehydrogenase [Pollutimonas bauzanensis]|uniref:Succinate-semialdehyde dehydrogenase / glutarate-semialdehyde dehydrogenase n=1 Tax=Pollutimonas bauzanensis TaxID=658167 RepID=A0A1M5Y8D7_9BURK|nr:NAD-dependent succinate-semialdehyde dehydrogenase [Pollutimonas bauzanensis]SHI07743.1 succinate-semialdehyde dehydrogenase / glutarate-semialdehyde dehydrogenase [Pollutimonas bauzanensis]